MFSVYIKGLYLAINLADIRNTRMSVISEPQVCTVPVRGGSALSPLSQNMA